MYRRQLLQDLCFELGSNNTIRPGLSHIGIVLPGVVGRHLHLCPLMPSRAIGIS